MGEHEHEHEHDHHGEHGHEHDHHHHDHPTPQNKDQMVALLDYMCKHNASHEDELIKMADKLKELGYDNAAEKVSEASESFSKGNAGLREALSLLK